MSPTGHVVAPGAAPQDATRYPFSAVVGQERAKLALALCAVDPLIGGVLLRGERGTGKSTLARSLAGIWPDGPFRTLPLGASEDRVTGGLDFERTIAEGRPVPLPGLLGAAHGGVLYVDEVNLLDENVTGLVLDAAAGGVTRVEREGVSWSYPSRFLLVGSMNPEEGPLRPQLVDRFGLCVDLVAEPDLGTRVTLLRRCEAFATDPAGFARTWATRERAALDAVLAGRALLPATRVAGEVHGYIAELCRGQHVAGHRADLVLARGAAAHAAWHGRVRVEVDDVLAVSELALAHRRRDTLPDAPPAPPPSPRPEDGDGADRPPDEGPGQDEAGGADPATAQGPPTAGTGTARDGTTAEDGRPGPGREDPRPSGEDSPDDRGRLDEPTETFRVRPIPLPTDRVPRTGSGRRHRTRSGNRVGRYRRSRPMPRGVPAGELDLALDATIRAAAVHQAGRRRPGSQRLVIRREDWQVKVRERKTGTVILFVVDASGSMGVRGRMAATKGAVLSLLVDAYQKRDKVGVLTFRGRRADLLLAPTASADLAGRLLGELRVGGRTPLAAALAEAHRTLRPLLRKDPTLRPLAILVSDGHATAGIEGPPSLEEVCRIAEQVATERRVRWLVVDTGDPRGVRLGHARVIAEALGAPAVAVDDLRSEDLVALVKGNRG
jgi:magnesium chelatase subunit D